LDDTPLPVGGNESRASLDTNSPSYSQSQSAETLNVSPENLKKTLSSDNMSIQSSIGKTKDGDVKGLRAAEAFVRPTPVAVHGDISSFGFDLRNCTFHLSLSAPSSTREEVPTVVYLPDFHFPAGQTSVEASGGKWRISSEDHNGATVQILRWWHAEGDQTMTVKGVVRKQGGAMLGVEEDEGYLQQCQRQACMVM
jgi:hypothetical protein